MIKEGSEQCRQVLTSIIISMTLFRVGHFEHMCSMTDLETNHSHAVAKSIALFQAG